MRKQIFVLILFLAIAPFSYAQNSDSLRYVSVRGKLDQIAKIDSNFTNKLDVSVSRIPVVELLKNIGKASALNINANLPTDRMVTCNFKQIRITE